MPTSQAIIRDSRIGKPPFGARWSRRDLDKLLRGLIDELNTVAFADDNQVMSVAAAKFYGLPTEPPHVVVELAEEARA